MADSVRLEIDIDDRSEGAAPSEADARRAAAEMLDSARQHRDAARRWQEERQADWQRSAGWAAPRVNAAGAAAETRDQRRAREADEDLPTPGGREKPKNPFDLGKPGMGGIDRLLYQQGFGRLGNLVAMLDKRAEALRKGESTLLPNLGVASAAGGVLGGAADAVAGSARSAGNVLGGVASNDYRASLNAAADGVIETARKIPVIGEALGGTLNLITAPARALVDVFQSMASRGKELAQYDPRIAQAQAMAEVESLFADIREAQSMGGEYAQVIKLENEFSIMWREAILPMKKVIVEWLVENAEGIKATLVGVAGTLKFLLDVVQAIGKLLVAAYDWTAGWVTGPLKDVLESINRNTRPEPKEEVNPVRQLYEVLGSGVGANTGRPADINRVREEGHAMGQDIVIPNFGG